MLKTCFKDIDINKLPCHIAIIMDGNGRWAQSKGVHRSKGHLEGINSTREIIKTSHKIGIKVLTFYAFSLENWQRPKSEVTKLMSFLSIYLQKEKKELLKNNIKLQVFGNLSLLPLNLQKEINKIEKETQKAKGMILNIALSYSSRWEILEAIKKISCDIKNGLVDPEKLTESMFSKYLCTSGLPDPDLLIRTSGELRISNFLLWQIAYTEIYITSIYWPDFKTEEFYKAILEYQNRKRRFGKI
ncbi:MAG: isoprenyl transferase [bacterium]